LARNPEGFADEELVELGLGEPRFLRRPLLVTDDGRVLAGGKAVAGHDPSPSGFAGGTSPTSGEG
jgi:hypothetical protein